MSPLAIVALLALTGYAIYRQSQRHEVAARGRFTMAIIYAVAGLVVGGFSQPDSAAEWALLIISIALSVVTPAADISNENKTIARFIAFAPLLAGIAPRPRVAESVPLQFASRWHNDCTKVGIASVSRPRTCAASQ